MLQAIALAIGGVLRIAFENFAERAICLVPEEVAIVGVPAERPLGIRLPARVRRIRESLTDDRRVLARAGTQE